MAAGRSFRPSGPTGPRAGRPSGRRGGGEDICAVGDLIHPRTVIDALLGRHVELVPRKESGHAIELGVPRTARILSGGAGWRGLGTNRRSPRSQRSRSSRVSSPACSRPGQSGREAMSDIQKITPAIFRVAIVYLRQSSCAQVEHNRESTDRQYASALRPVNSAGPPIASSSSTRTSGCPAPALSRDRGSPD